MDQYGNVISNRRRDLQYHHVSRRPPMHDGYVSDYGDAPRKRRHGRSPPAAPRPRQAPLPTRTHLVPPEEPIIGISRDVSLRMTEASAARVPSPPPAPHQSRGHRAGDANRRERPMVSKEARVPSPDYHMQNGRGNRVAIPQNATSGRKRPNVTGLPAIVTPKQAQHPTKRERHHSLSPRRDVGNLRDSFSPPAVDRKRRNSDSRTGNLAPPLKPEGMASPAATLLNTNDTFNRGSLGEQPYHYRPLGARQIRLLRIYPARKHQVSCEIIHVSLDQLRPYLAISYAWGNTGSKEYIRLYHEDFQCELPVASSLYGALEALRDKSESVWVWVDGLCIDQQNRDERSQQVQLMTSIYSSAETVAIWLGPEADGSHNAVRFLQDVADKAGSPEEVSKLIRSSHASGGLAAVVSLFARNYWQRLWIVQEVLNSSSDPIVYCGSTRKSWNVYRKASNLFKAHRAEINEVSKGKMDEWFMVPYQFSTSQILVYEGPNSLPGYKTDGLLGDESLLHILRLYRRKLASDPRDKLYGILGILPESIRQDFQPNYDKSVKLVYSDIVDTLIRTTSRLDVICDAIHFPLYTGAHGLPSFVPDWSHIPQTSAMGHRFKFSASKNRRAHAEFTDSHLNKLKFRGIHLDTIEIQGVAVGTHCRSSDWLMAFLHWRALVLQYIARETVQNGAREAADFALSVQEEFAETLCLGQIPDTWVDRPRQWLEVCYHVFATLLRARLPHLALDAELSRHAGKDVAQRVELGPGVSPRQFLQTHFGDRMMGRCFLLTKQGRLGLGSGYMAPGDIVVVPLGCSTPVLLRADGPNREYRFVGDLYLHRFMRGRAIDMLDKKKLELMDFTMH